MKRKAIIHYFFYLPVLAVLASSAGVHVYRLVNRGDHQDLGAIPFVAREKPLQAVIYPIDGLPENIDLKSNLCLAAAKPRFNEKRMPVPLVYHLVRTWGRDSTFEFFSMVGQRQTWTTSDPTLLIMTNDSYFKKYSSYALKRLLTRSQYGIHVASYGDFAELISEASSHIGKYHDTLAKIGMKSNTVLTLEDGSRATLRDALADEAARLEYDIEIEWLAQAFYAYAATPSWTNRFGNPVGLRGITEHLTTIPFGRGSCSGIHVLHALATAVNIDRQTPFLGEETRHLAENKLRHCSGILGRTQMSDGSWSPDWHMESEQDSLAMNIGIMRKIDITGHHLEWMIICPPEFRPNSRVVRRSLDFILNRLPELRHSIEEDWHNYLPMSHAIRALLLVSGRLPN